MPSSACCVPARHLRSFPTRRSSDLQTTGPANERAVAPVRAGNTYYVFVDGNATLDGESFVLDLRVTGAACGDGMLGANEQCDDSNLRSEEHTSELQSPCNLVCRLLLAASPLGIYALSLHDALPIFKRRARPTSAR